MRPEAVAVARSRVIADSCQCAREPLPETSTGCGRKAGNQSGASSHLASVRRRRRRSAGTALRGTLRRDPLSGGAGRSRLHPLPGADRPASPGPRRGHPDRARARSQRATHRSTPIDNVELGTSRAVNPHNAREERTACPRRTPRGRSTTTLTGEVSLCCPSLSRRPRPGTLLSASAVVSGDAPSPGHSTFAWPSPARRTSAIAVAGWRLAWSQVTGDGQRVNAVWSHREQLHDLRQMLAASGQHVAYSPGPNSNPTCDEELRRWLAVSTDADAIAGFRAGWTRLDRFVGPRLRDWEDAASAPDVTGPASSVISPRSSPRSGSFSGSNHGRNVLAPYAAW